MSTYTTSAAPISDSLAHYKAWGQFMGAGFTTCGWVAQTGHGEVVASGTGGTYAWTNVAAAPTVALTAPQSYTFKGAFVPSAAYIGGNTINIATEVDVVTYSGLTYQHITASSSLATTPDLDPTNWIPLTFEIWKSSGSNTTSLPIYVRLTYTKTSGTNVIKFMLSVGTGIDSNGNLTGTATLGVVAPTYHTSIDPSTSTSSSLFPCYFSGDADNVRWMMFDGTTVTNYTNLVVIDRAKTGTGTDSDAFVYVGIMATSAATVYSETSILLNSAYGGTVLAMPAWNGTISANGYISSLNLFGSTPPMPIYPLVGFQANPLLGLIGVQGADTTDGGTYTAWMYGANHNYLVYKLTTTATVTLNNVTSGVYPAMRYE